MVQAATRGNAAGRAAAAQCSAMSVSPKGLSVCVPCTPLAEGPLWRVAMPRPAPPLAFHMVPCTRMHALFSVATPVGCSQPRRVVRWRWSGGKPPHPVCPALCERPGRAGRGAARRFSATSTVVTRTRVSSLAAWQRLAGHRGVCAWLGHATRLQKALPARGVV